MRYQRSAISIAMVVALGAAISACGTSASSNSAKAATKVAPLTVALAGAAGDVALPVIAQVNGYFNHQGVQVSLKVYGSVAFSEAATGRADLAIGGASNAFAPAAQGRQTEIVRLDEAGPVSAGLTVATNSKYHTLMSLSGQRVSCLGVNGSSWGSAHALSDYVVAHGGKPFQIVPLTTDQAEEEAAASGQVAAAVAPPSIVGAYIASGKLRVLLNPASATAASIFGSNMVSEVEYGLASDLNSKQASVTRYLAALNQAASWAASHTDAQVAADLLKSPLFTGFTQNQLSVSFSYDRPLIARAGNGMVTSVAWAKSLNQFATWSLGLNVHSAPISYQKMVDMAPLKAALNR